MSSDDERPAKRTSRQRTQTRKAMESSESSAKCDAILNRLSDVVPEKDVAKGRSRGGASDDDDDYHSDDDDDADFGKRASVASKRRKGSAVLQSIASKNNFQQRQLGPQHIPQPVPTLDADFKPLADLKGVDPSAVVGRRIRCLYEQAGGGGGEGEGGSEQQGEAPALQASVGVVTYYGAEGRLHAVYDGEEECELRARAWQRAAHAGSTRRQRTQATRMCAGG